MENNETEWEAAVRETEEESGLVIGKDFLCNNKSKIIEAVYPVKRGQKKVAYFLGRVLPTANLKLSHESLDMKWLPLSELKQFIKFRSETLLRIFEQAEEYLKESFT